MSRALQDRKAAVLWVTTEKGEAMPVDAAPVRGGNIRLEGSAARPTAIYVQPLFETDEQFRTCPDAKAHRKAKR